MLHPSFFSSASSWRAPSAVPRSGSGCATLAEPAARYAQARVLGIDNSEAMLRSARQREDAGHEREVLDAVHVAVIDVDDAVAVEEQRFAHDSWAT